MTDRAPAPPEIEVPWAAIADDFALIFAAETDTDALATLHDRVVGRRTRLRGDGYGMYRYGPTAARANTTKAEWFTGYLTSFRRRS